MNCIEGLFRILQMCNDSARGGWRAIGTLKGCYRCSGYIGAAETMDLSDRKNGIEKIEER